MANMAEKPRRRTIKLKNPVKILSCANIGGEQEGEGPLKDWFDEIGKDGLFGEKTWEKAESEMQKRVLIRALERADLKPDDLNFVLAGDLLNQCVASTFGLREFEIPFYGLYGACSTMGEALSLGALLIDGGFADYCACLTSSHFATAERQYRMPMPYGNQRAPTAQWTATAAGCAILARSTRVLNYNNNPGDITDHKPGENNYNNYNNHDVWITRVTCGKIVDKGIKDAANMGAAMAPAAYDTLQAFFSDTDTKPDEYDNIITGDLGELGHSIVRDFFRRDGMELGENFLDCGIMLYDREKQDMHAGGSGCGCSASVFNGYILGQLKRGIWKRVIFAPTGALLSPTSSFQGESIPGICHAVCLESD